MILRQRVEHQRDILDIACDQPDRGKVVARILKAPRVLDQPQRALESDQPGVRRWPARRPARVSSKRHGAKAGCDKTAVVLPLDRFYMNEKMAPRAEQAYRENSRTANHNAHIRVRVRHGDAVIEDLVLDGKPIREYLKAAAK